jgi:hypothetical protein
LAKRSFAISADYGMAEVEKMLEVKLIHSQYATHICWDTRPPASLREKHYRVFFLKAK